MYVCVMSYTMQSLLNTELQTQIVFSVGNMFALLLPHVVMRIVSMRTGRCFT